MMFLCIWISKAHLCDLMSPSSLKSMSDAKLLKVFVPGCFDVPRSSSTGATTGLLPAKGREAPIFERKLPNITLVVPVSGSTGYTAGSTVLLGTFWLQWLDFERPF
jgi:hypothetical protein